MTVLASVCFAKPTNQHHGGRPVHASHRAPQPPAGPLATWIVIDAETGEALSAHRPDTLVFPASLTKMMTLYLTFQALNRHRLTLGQRLPVSLKASRQEPTKLWLKPGDKVRVRDLLLAVVTRSANDAAVVLAEGLAGSEATFARRMTATARRLGMRHTVYRNASGLPNRAQHTTARDLARLALALYQDFPREYGYFSIQAFRFRGNTIAGHNHLLDSYPGADGIKTGYTRASGFNLAASAERDGRRLIGVVIGGSSVAERDKQMAVLLDRGFASLDDRRPESGDQVLAGDAPKKAGAMTRLIANLAPVANAIAASSPAADCGIQLGAVRSRGAAERLAHAASRLSLAQGRPVRILPPSTRGKTRLYQVRVWNFTHADARRACAELPKPWHCMVVGSSVAR